jgi:hypothetical protein
MKTKDIKPLIEKEIQPFLERLMGRKEVLGVVLLGGLGKRNFLDEYSDIDISIFIKSKDKLKFSLPFEFHYATKAGNLEFNIHQQIIEEEERKDRWDNGKIEAYIRGNILYDPTKRVANLIKSKTVFNESEALKRLIWIIQQYVWRGQIHSLRAVKRGYPEAGNDLLNQCAELFLEAIYLLNRTYLPHKKWALVYLDNLPREYSNLKNLFKKAMIVKSHTGKEINRRIRVLNKAYEFIKKKTYEEYPHFPLNPYEYYYRNFVQITPETVIDRLFLDLKKKVPLSLKEENELYGELCINLITNQRLLNTLSNSNNMKGTNGKKYKHDIREIIKHGKDSKD